MAAKSIPIKQSCSTVSETMLSFRDSHEDLCNFVLFQSPNIFDEIKMVFDCGPLGLTILSAHVVATQIFLQPSKEPELFPDIVKNLPPR